NAKSETCTVDAEIAEGIDEAADKPDFLFRFAQRALAWGGVGCLDLATRKRDLAGVIGKMRRALGQQHGWFAMVDNRNQDRRGPDRPFAGDDLEHPVGAGIAALRNDVGIDQARRDIEIKSRPAPGEKLHRAELKQSRLEHRFVQSATLTSSA